MSDWLVNISDVKSGNSAVLNENFYSFYLIHGFAIGTILCSLVSCVIVIYLVLRNSCTKNKKIDISIRFPLYLAIADGLWSISHLIDHTYLIYFKSYPNENPIALSVNLWFFLGYQQLIHCSLAVYTYLKVIRRSSLELGPWEWKLHIFCSSFLGSTILIFLPNKSFGSSGFWYLHDVNSIAGLCLGFTIGLVATSNGLITAFCYYSVKKEVGMQKAVLNISSRMTYHRRTMDKLSTFVKIASCLYTPSGLLYLALTVQNVLGFIEPITVFLTILLANSSGWANALGYFHNEKQLKNLNSEEKPTSTNEIPSNSKAKILDASLEKY